MTLEKPQELGVFVKRIMEGLSTKKSQETVNDAAVSVATPQTVPVGERSKIQIKTIGICAGSGGSMLNGLDVDLLFTGELSHHEALAGIEAGRCVITAFHSNSERAFLEQRMMPALWGKLEEEWDGDGDFHIEVSQCDRDPYQVVTPGTSQW